MKPTSEQYAEALKESSEATWADVLKMVAALKAAQDLEGKQS